MEWFEIVIGLVIVFVGAYIRGKIYELKKNMSNNDSCRRRKNE